MAFESDADKTAQKQQPRARGRPFPQGQSGNLKGRPKGSRNKLGEDFIAALHEDFQKHSAKVIERVRTERPDAYLKVIASIVPKQLDIGSANPFEVWTDDELESLGEMLQAVRGMAESKGSTAH